MPTAARKEPAPTAPEASGHHRAHLLSLDGKSHATVLLPLAFSTPVRADLIRRAVVAQQSHRRQPYGTSPTAGLRHSVEWSGKGQGVARTPRLMDSNRGAQAPNTVGGRPAHPPRVERIWGKKINEKERRLAFASALAATREAKLAAARGHEVPHGLALPIVLDTPLEAVDSTADARAVLEQLRLWDDVERSADGTHLKASGRARRRGRVRRTPRSVLVVTSGLHQARGFANLSGVDVVPVPRLSTEDLAPGGTPGRLTLYSRAAVESLRARLKEATPA
ncbi:MAG TPA: 50S ribosomal protein L4 [Thermoplasmata archaeon]|nr:50S ribosomal protein L4 [Thermoplasmata archaeon]